jgi:hypothetical protein
MPHWTQDETRAHRSVAIALMGVDSLLSYVKGGKGKPSKNERALFAAAVVFTYGIWENFVEQIAIELAERIAPQVIPERVPESVRKALQKSASAWELAVSPGWRVLWQNQVKVQAVGDDAASTFGMNTAKAGQVKALLSLVGVFEPFREVAAEAVPEYLSANGIKVEDAVNALVELRGEIVHTGNIPEALRKGHVLDWRKFVGAAADSIDKVCREQCRALVS